MSPTRSSAAPVDDSSPTTAKAPPPLSILFVCLGNICRSPMAEAVFRSLTSTSPHIRTIDSAGTGAYHEGSSPDPRTMSTLAANNIHDYTHSARKIRASDFSTFDYILAMDDENLQDLQRLRRRVVKSGEGEMGKVLLFGDFGGRRGEQVGDPYYGKRDGFEVAFEQMVRFSKGFVGEVLEVR